MVIGDFYISWLLNGLVVVLFVFFLICFGLFVVVVLIFVQDLLRFLIIFDMEVWYFKFGFFVFVVVVVLLVCGFYILIGGYCFV